MHGVKKMLALLLAAAMLPTMFVGCDNESKTTNETGNNSGSGTKSDTLVIANSPMPGKFGPFFANSAYDRTVNDFLGLGILGTDRSNEPVLHSGEKRVFTVSGKEYEYGTLADWDITVNKDGSVDYAVKMRDDIKFSDGTTANIDDVLFSLYVIADPSFDGNYPLDIPIEGLQEYRGSMDSRFEFIKKAGSVEYKENEIYTKEQYDTFWSFYNNEAIDLYIQDICSFAIQNGYVAEDASIADIAQIFDSRIELADDATSKDFWDAIMALPDFETPEETEARAWNHNRFYYMEQAFKDDESKAAYFEYFPTGDGADYISGVTRVDDYSMTIHCTEYDCATIYDLGLPIVPRKFYGDPNCTYDYEKHQFGFPRGDLSAIRSKIGTPTVTCGPYVFKSYKDNIVTLEANPYFIDGEPKIKYLKFQAANTNDFLSGVLAGTFDVSDPAINQDSVAKIKKENSNGELSGDKLTTVLVDNNGFGYFGANVNLVNVDGKPDSAESKNLRRAIFTVVSLFRDAGVDSYYGDFASRIEYPISRISWAAPVATDDDYKVAYSTALDGSKIYSDSMSMEEKKQKAVKAALEYFEAAGYKVENGKLKEAPTGAKGLTEETAYEFLVAGDGVQNHAAFPTLSDAQELLKTIGFYIKITDADGMTFQNAVFEGHTAEFFAAGYNGGGSDPASGTELFMSTSNNNLECFNDSKLDKLLVDARASSNQTYRKAAYKQVFEIVDDWAVVLPFYQRANGAVISSERVNVDTLPEDMTPFWPWYADITYLELKN